MFTIDDNKIDNLLNTHAVESNQKTNEVLAKARELNGLTPEDVAYLLNITDPSAIEQLYETAYYVKNEIYGNRMVLFAPLYISNYCKNDCLYCGFRVKNRSIERKTLTIEQIRQETQAILEQGHKRILLLMGEDPKLTGDDYLFEAIENIYSVKDSKGSSIRRINLEIAPLTDEQFQKLRNVPIGTYTVFQETYHRETYSRVHVAGKKADFDFRLTTMDRALTNGMHDVGIGALFGLYDYKFEVLAMLLHSIHLESHYGTGPHTISVPRMKPASDAPISLDMAHNVSDEDFKKLIAILRCAVPYTGIILSTREPADLRSQIFRLGVSQLSAGSKTNPGGYKNFATETGQFQLNDCRSSGEIIDDLIKKGFIPSFCTACYRLNRVGEDFMDQAKPGLIKLYCQPNGLCTLQEYLEDYADATVKIHGEELIKKELSDLPNDNIRSLTSNNIDRIKFGERDIYI
jgi:2-iminoacetate synthase